LDGFDIDIVRVSVAIELRFLEFARNSVRFPLTFGPSGSSEDPEINITRRSASPGNTPIQDDSNDVANVLAELRYRSFDGLMILQLRDPKDRILWNRQPSPVDLNESLVTFSRFNDQFIRTENIHSSPDRLV